MRLSVRKGTGNGDVCSKGGTVGECRPAPRAGVLPLIRMEAPFTHVAATRTMIVEHSCPFGGRKIVVITAITHIPKTIRSGCRTRTRVIHMRVVRRSALGFFQPEKVGSVLVFFHHRLKVLHAVRQLQYQKGGQPLPLALFFLNHFGMELLRQWRWRHKAIHDGRGKNGRLPRVGTTLLDKKSLRFGRREGGRGGEGRRRMDDGSIFPLPSFAFFAFPCFCRGHHMVA